MNRAVLDSAILYEYLKPIAFNLKLENVQLHKENLALRATSELTAKLHDLDRQHWEELLASETKKKRRARRIGAGLAIIAIIAAAK